MEPERSLLCLQQPATGSYPEPNEFNPRPHTLFLWDPPVYVDVFQVSFSLQFSD
jgi:hypothetical protein